MGEWLATYRGTKQGDPVSPNTSILVIERILGKISDKEKRGVIISSARMNNFAFADDINLPDTPRRRQFVGAADTDFC